MGFTPKWTSGNAGDMVFSTGPWAPNPWGYVSLWPDDVFYSLGILSATGVTVPEDRSQPPTNWGAMNAMWLETPPRDIVTLSGANMTAPGAPFPWSDSWGVSIKIVGRTAHSVGLPDAPPRAYAVWVSPSYEEIGTALGASVYTGEAGAGNLLQNMYWTAMMWPGRSQELKFKALLPPTYTTFGPVIDLGALSVGDRIALPATDVGASVATFHYDLDSGALKAASGKTLFVCVESPAPGALGIDGYYAPDIPGGWYSVGATFDVTLTRANPAPSMAAGAHRTGIV